MAKKILLIEDDEDIRFIYKVALEHAQYVTSEAADGKSGLALLQKDIFDLLLLDILLPDTNGIEILKKVKANERIKNLPVIILSNLGDDSVIKEGLTLGAVKYLVKASYTPDQIIAEVKQIVGE